MICPLYKGECNLVRCHDNGRCMPAPADNISSPPPPTLAEIERLVDEAMWRAGLISIQKTDESTDKAQEAKAALMAAIRAYGRE